MDSAELKITHSPERSAFTVTIDGLESYVRYIESPGTLDIVSTVVDPKHRGGGVAAKLTEAALTYAQSKGLKVIPTCSYTAAYLKRRSGS